MKIAKSFTSVVNIFTTSAFKKDYAQLYAKVIFATLDWPFDEQSYLHVTKVIRQHSK
jgi:hypothetical protein